MRVRVNEREKKVNFFSYDGNLFGILGVYIRNWLEKIVPLQKFNLKFILINTYIR